MRVERKEKLRFFREQTKCELCGRICPQGTDPAHVFARGSGRLDISINLLSLCRGFAEKGWVSCHQDYDHGKISQYQVLAKVAKREGTVPDAIVQVIHFLRYLPKDATDRQFEVGVVNWDFSQAGRMLARRMWKEIAHEPC